MGSGTSKSKNKLVPLKNQKNEILNMPLTQSKIQTVPEFEKNLLITKKYAEIHKENEIPKNNDRLNEFERKRSVRASQELNNMLKTKNIFDEEQLARLKVFFRNKDNKNTGFISVDDFICLKEIQIHAFKNRIFEMVSLTLEEYNRKMNFDLFTKILSVFHPRSEKERKTKFLFRIYDIDEDEKISLEDLIDFYKLIYFEDNTVEYIENRKLALYPDKNPINEETIKKIANYFIQEFNAESFGGIDYEKFKMNINNIDLEKRMTIFF